MWAEKLARAIHDIIEISMPLRSLAAVNAFNVGMVLANAFDIRMIILGNITIIFSYCAGAVYNNIRDIEGDSINDACRPLPNSAITLDFAWMLMFFYMILSFLFALAAHPLLAAANIICIILGIVYSKYTKSILVVSYLTLTTTHLVIPIITGYIIFANFDIFIASIAIFIIFTEFLSISIKDFKDVKGDRKTNVRTLPVVLSPKRASKVAFIGMCLPLVFVWFPFFMFNLSLEFLAVFMVVGIAKVALGYKLLKDQKKKTVRGILNKFRYVMIFQIASWCLS